MTPEKFRKERYKGKWTVELKNGKRGKIIATSQAVTAKGLVYTDVSILDSNNQESTHTISEVKRLLP